MDEAVKQGKVGKCAQLLFHVDVTADCLEASVKGAADVTQINVTQEKHFVGGEICFYCSFMAFSFVCVIGNKSH